MDKWITKTGDGPGCEVTVEAVHSGELFFSRLAIDFGTNGDYLAVYLSAEEARNIAGALIESQKQPANKGDI